MLPHSHAESSPAATSLQRAKAWNTAAPLARVISAAIRNTMRLRRPSALTARVVASWPAVEACALGAHRGWCGWVGGW